MPVRVAPSRPVVLRRHRADEARRAVTALGPAALGHLPLDRVQLPRLPQPSAVTTSCWSNPAAGTRQALSATQHVRPWPSSRATSTAQAPHSPSAHPSLQPVSPLPRSHSSKVTCPPTSPSSRARPLTTTRASVVRGSAAWDPARRDSPHTLLPPLTSASGALPMPLGGRQRVLLASLPTIAPGNPKHHMSMETYFRIMDIGLSSGGVGPPGACPARSARPPEPAASPRVTDAPPRHLPPLRAAHNREDSRFRESFGSIAPQSLREANSSPQRPQNPGTACQARPAGGASSRVTVPSISPYGRSAA